MKINIAYAPDDKYVNQTIVSIESAIQNNKNNNLEFIIMYSKLSDENISKLKTTECENAKIRFLLMNENLFSDLTLSSWVTIQAWFRIALPDMCKDLDRVLYLDCDTLVLGDLSELFSINLENKFFAGVKDVWGVSKYVKRLKMTSDVYVNSGMLLFNSDYCRKEKFFEKVTEFAKNNKKIIEFCDQDSINKIGDDKKIVLNPKYNFMDTWWRGGYYEFEGKEEQEYLQAKENAVIVHLTGLKPAFRGCKNYYNNVWWDYAKLTTIYDELKSDYENSSEPVEKKGLFKTLFSIANEYNGKNKNKILTILGFKIRLS